MRVVLDTLDQIIRGEITLCLSDYILSELADVVRRPKFGFPSSLVHQIVAELSAISELVRPAEEISKIEADLADNHVLECAVEAHADYIVTGDAHLLDLREFRSIRLIHPQLFLSALG